MRFGKESSRHQVPGISQDVYLEQLLRRWAMGSNIAAALASAGAIFFLLASARSVFALALLALTLVLISSNAAIFWLVRLIQKRRREEEHKASYDPVTDVLNRAAYEKILDEELRRAGRYHYPLSLCLIDLDQFRKFNKSFGSAKGDEFLRKFSKFLSANVRISDCVARFESDTFAVLLPHTDTARAQRFLMRTQAGCEEQLDTSFCAGVTAFQSGESREELIRRSLTALGQAKKEGGRHIRPLIPGQDAQAVLTF